MGCITASVAPSRPLVIPIFLPHLGCPHQCIFCNQRAITGRQVRLPSADQIAREVNRFLKYGKRPPASVQLSFYGGNFLGLAGDHRQYLLDAAATQVAAGRVESIRFSTRPDTVNQQTLDGLSGFAVSTVELGVQSMNDAVLAGIGRGHGAAETRTAAHLIKARGYELGLQMMVGLPGDSAEGAMATARQMADLSPDFVRIYPTLVLAGSPLAQWYRTGRYRPMALEACVDLVKKLYLHFRKKKITVVRMGLQAADGLDQAHHLLAGPYHPAFGHLVHARVALDAICRILDETGTLPGQITIQAHPRTISRVQGLNKRNITRLHDKYALAGIDLIQDERLATDQLLVDGRTVTLP